MQIYVSEGREVRGTTKRSMLCGEGSFMTNIVGRTLVSKNFNRSYGVGVWKAIRSHWIYLHANSSIRVGNGRNTI